MGGHSALAARSYWRRHVVFSADRAAPGWRDNTANRPVGRRVKQADFLLELASEANLFRSDDGVGYADINVGQHRETWPILSKGFKSWLKFRYFSQTQGAPRSEAVRSTIEVLDARAQYDAPTLDVYVRVAPYEGKIYLDLCDEAWRVVEIGIDGWRIIEKSPVRFRRARGMLPLPAPTAGGDIDALRELVNIKHDDDFILFVAWYLQHCAAKSHFRSYRRWVRPVQGSQRL